MDVERVIELQVRRIWFGDAEAKHGLQKPLRLKLEKAIDIVGFSFSQCVNMKWSSEIIVSKKSQALKEKDSTNDIVASAGLTPNNPTSPPLFFPANHTIHADELFIHFFSNSFNEEDDCGWSVYIYYI